MGDGHRPGVRPRISLGSNRAVPASPHPVSGAYPSRTAPHRTAAADVRLGTLRLHRATAAGQAQLLDADVQDFLGVCARVWQDRRGGPEGIGEVRELPASADAVIRLGAFRQARCGRALGRTAAT
ncbi:hypothetical protein [Streptomyces sp. NPDC059802]|uniref:hypothetical protein n=1 Tax=Streptomyces sp. NPDC059802 TaxID=3346952 RepID=UPI003664B2EF